MNPIPRSEHPRPQFVREEWRNLNGPWTYEFDFGKSGQAREMEKSTGFRDVICVPFCPESKLSGVEHKDFIPQLYYHRKLQIPAEWRDKTILLHFGGVDYVCEAYVNGVSAGIHYGGMCSFTFDVTSLVEAGKEYDLVVRARDEQTDGWQTPGMQAYGKQCKGYLSEGCYYTRTTGIWQTVWMEAVHGYGLASCRITPALDAKAFVFRPQYLAAGRELKLRTTISGKGVPTVVKTVPAVSGIEYVVDLGENVRPWSPEDPFLYDVLFEVLDASGAVIDAVRSYGGLRKIHVEKDRIFLNNKPVFLRLVLDQGFYPDGIWTAPSDADLKRDVELAMAAGFNGARLHQKVFEERFHYWADKLGYLTWGESASWGTAFCYRMDVNSSVAWRSLEYFKSEWREAVERDYNHPSIIAWTPTNETWIGRDVAEYRRMISAIYDLTRALDPTRPVNDCSGYHHAKTDLWTIHTYCPDAGELKKFLHPEDSPVLIREGETGYSGQPYIDDEWGGFRFIPANSSEFAKNSWGYHGIKLQSVEELCAKIREQAELMNTDPAVSGWCYTQLTDVEQEQNGVYNYNRTQKGDPALFKAAFTAGLDRRKETALPKDATAKSHESFFCVL